MKNVINCLKKVDKILLICSLILFVFGLLMVFSASNVTSAAKLNNPYHYFYFQLLFLVVGLILGFISIFKLIIIFVVEFSKNYKLKLNSL